MLIIGIDPGTNANIDSGRGGAIAVLNIDGSVAGLYDMPLAACGKIVSGTGLVKLLSQFGTDTMVALEESHAMAFKDKKTGEIRSQSPASMLELGKHWGTINGILLALDIPHQHVAPTKWQAVFKVKGKQSGNDSVDIALGFYPHAPLIRESSRAKSGVVRYHGRSDALLIARWQWLQINYPPLIRST